MRKLSILGLAVLLVFGMAPARAQDTVSSVATLHLADGTSVALVEWKLTYDFATWKQKQSISLARSLTHESSLLLLGKKSYSVKGDTLTISHEEGGDMVRVTSMNLKNGGDLKIEAPTRDAVAPDLEKNMHFQPRSLDVVGKTLSGIERSFCVASFSALVECGSTPTTRVVKIDFN